MGNGARDEAAASPEGDRTSQHAAVVEMAREIVNDLRAELPRIDARAAAGTALTAAVLVSVVSRGSIPSPVYAFGVSAAVFLTIALLLFLATLFPTITVARGLPAVHARERAGALKRRASPQIQASDLAAELANTDPVDFYAGMAVRVQARIRMKQVLLALAFLAGLLAVAALASGASLALLLGWR